jgi:hypothetical protein
MKQVCVVWYNSHGYEPLIKAACINRDRAIRYINAEMGWLEESPLTENEFEHPTQSLMVYNLGDAEYVVETLQVIE